MRIAFMGLQVWLLILWVIFPALPWWLIFMPLLIPAVAAGAVTLFVTVVVLLVTMFGSFEYVSSSK